MNDANKFILTSDYAALKNDASTQSVSVTVPGSQAVAGGGLYTVSADLVIGAAGASMRSQGSSSKDGNKRYTSSTLDYQRTGTSLGFPAFYNLLASLSRINATTVRLTAYISNPSSDPLTGASGDETFTFFVTTFKSPFD